MLYITRNRFKDSIGASDLPKMNQIIDADIIPALNRVQGVRSTDVYNSISGELTFVLDIEDMATIDRILADSGARDALGKIYDSIIRTGGEVLYDRPAWQGLYGRD